MESLCFGSFREWHNVRVRKFCRPRRPIVAHGRADWLSEIGLFRIRFRNAALLLMLRLAKMFEKHSKHMEGNYWAPPPPPRHLSLATVGRCSAVVSAREWRSSAHCLESQCRQWRQCECECRRFEAWGKFGYPSSFTPHDSWVMTLPVSFGWDIISCFPFSMVSMAEEVKYILYLTISFLNDRGSTVFFNQVLFSRILSGLAIYLQNDLNFSENITLTVHNAQCTPTDWQSAVGDIANWRLKIGFSRQVCTKRRPDRRH